LTRITGGNPTSENRAKAPDNSCLWDDFSLISDKKGKQMSSSRFVITVIGLDRVGIVAGISRVMAEYNVNIADIRQTIMSDLFTMIMLAEVKGENFDLSAFQNAMSAIGKELGVEVIVQHEDVFRFMHRI
jgi:ACT domain-containing protein